MRPGRHSAPENEKSESDNPANPTKKPTLSNKIVGSLCLFTGLFLIACLLVILTVSPKEDKSRILDLNGILFFGLVIFSLLATGVRFWRGR